MQLSNSGTKAQVTGVQHTQQFQMQMNAKMFSILTDKLYQNKEGAIIRELSANARDAHVEANKNDQPFDITMPSWLSKEFKIRDYGTGINPELFYDTYTNLGHSTKDGENTSIGAYGLGSKTPFAITESYTISNYWNGTVYVYTAFKDEGMPTVSLMGSEPTEEENGLEISVDTSNSDAFSNHEELKRQLKYFEVKPNIIGYDDFEWYDVPDLSSGFFIEKGNYNAYIEVVMGGIPYRINSYRHENLGITELIGQMRSHLNITLKAELGDVDIPPSRESLEITERTKLFLQRKIKEIKAKYQDNFRKNINKSKNLVEVHNLLTDSVDEWLKSCSHVYTFNGTMYTKAQLEELTRSTIPYLVVKLLSKYRKTLETPAYLNDVYSITEYIKRRSGFSGTGIGKLIVNDLSPRLAAAIKDKRDQLNGGEGAIVMSPTERKMKYFKEASDKLETTLEVLGFSTVRLSTMITLDAKKVVSGSKRKVKPNQVWKVMENGDVDKDLPIMEIPKDGYYVPMSNWTMSANSLELRYIISVMGKEVFALRSEALKEVKESKALKPITDLSKLVKKNLILSSKENLQTAVNYCTLEEILPCVFFGSNAHDVISCKPKSKLKDLIIACNEAFVMRHKKNISTWQKRLTIDLDIKVKPAKHKIPVRILKLAEHAKENYAELLQTASEPSYRYKADSSKALKQASELIIGQFK